MAHETPSTIPSLQEPTSRTAPNHPSSPASSDNNSTASEEDFARNRRLSRPRLESRKSSGTMIVNRNSPTAMTSEPQYDEDDVRSMSPRRNSTEVDRLSEAARQDLRDQARVLQTSLQDIVDKIERVKTEQEKLEAGNKFLQSYIGELMQTSKITAAPSRTKGKGRSGK